MTPATAVGPHSTSLPRVTKRQGAGVDHYVKAFEAAWTRSGTVAIEDYLPPSDDAAYARIVRELVRVDIELCWDAGRPRDLDEYCRAFPEVFSDRAMLTPVAFEEYRQRRDHGQAPEPTEYARKYGVDAMVWPSAEPPRTVVVDGAAGLAAASHIYREFAADRGDLETAVTSGAAGDALDLFRAIHQADPPAARRLADATLALPDTGDVFQGFRLEAELGRGAFGRVFLARQAVLADRYVAVKITAAEAIGGVSADESQTLAQLQHTNIVPIHSVHSAARSGPSACPISGRRRSPMSSAVCAARPFCRLRADI